MNTGAFDTLTGAGSTAVRADFAALLGDAELGALTFTHRARGNGGANFARGERVSPVTSTEIVGVLTPLTRAEVERLSGAQVGDVAVLVSTSELSTAPAPDDTLSTSTRRYHVVSVEQYGLGTHYRIVAREAT